MAAKDKFHDHVKNALVNDGWTVTHEQLPIKWGKKPLLVDFGAERLLMAQKGTRKIAVEVKSFISNSEMTDLYNAIGQFVLYRKALQHSEPDRELFLAIREDAYLRLLATPEGEELRADENIHLIVFSPDREEIVKWIS